MKVKKMVDLTKNLIVTRKRDGGVLPARFLFQRHNGKYAILVNPGEAGEAIINFNPSDGLSAGGSYKLSNPPRTVERRLWIDGLHAVGEGRTASGSGPDYRMQMSEQMDLQHLIHDDGNNHLKLVIDAETGKILEVSLLP